MLYEVITPAASGGQSVGEALREAGTQKSFHYLFWGYFVCGFQTARITSYNVCYTKLLRETYEHLKRTHPLPSMH